MDANLRWRVNLRLVLLFSLLVVWWEPIASAVEDIEEDNADLCSSNQEVFLPLPYSNLPNMVCKHIWNSYVLRYTQTEDHVLTIVLSALYTTGWVGIGFSNDGMMLNASAMVGWSTESGLARIKQYHVEGFTPAEVIPNKGHLPLTDIPPYVTLHGANIYLAFQLKFDTHVRSQPILLAFATKYPGHQHHHLPHHDDKTTINFDFSRGTLDTVASVPQNIFSVKKTHGLLGLIGWGLILPYGAIAARYLRHRDPLWYYLHVVIQFVGFIIALAAILFGMSLYKKLNASIPTHRGIGIFVLVLSILQVLAFFLRPKSNSKYRRYWNWYHQWFGRIALFFGALNVVFGIQIGEAGLPWKIGYGFLLGMVLLSCIVLEALQMLKRSEKPVHPPDFQMNGVQ